MKLAGSYAFEAPRSTVWAALFDPEVLAKTLPGCEKLERDGDTFKGEINVKMGPVQGKFQGKVDISDVKELEGYTMVVDGRGPAGFVKANARLGVVAEGQSTRLDYESDIQVGGKIASVGQRLLDASSRAIVKQSLEGLHQQIKALAARQAAQASEAPRPISSAPASFEEEPPDEEGWGASEDASGERPRPEGGGAAPAAAPKAAAPEKTGEPSTVAGRAAPSPSPAEAAPAGVSQAAFALGVAKEVTKELLPPRIIALVVVVLVVLWIIYRAVSG